MAVINNYIPGMWTTATVHVVHKKRYVPTNDSYWMYGTNFTRDISMFEDGELIFNTTEKRLCVKHADQLYYVTSGDLVINNWEEHELVGAGLLKNLEDDLVAELENPRERFTNPKLVSYHVPKHGRGFLTVELNQLTMDAERLDIEVEHGDHGSQIHIQEG